ncbi:hypothetical protein VTH82DRAFT_5065 [Thermothelomyces myriococcoides]
MTFSDSANHILLEGSVLRAEVMTEEGAWVWAEIDLDTIIGNNDGEFDPAGENFSQTAEDIALDGTVLTARLQRADGEWNDPVSIDLNDVLENIDGTLQRIQG